MRPRPGGPGGGGSPRAGGQDRTAAASFPHLQRSESSRPPCAFLSQTRLSTKRRQPDHHFRALPLMAVDRQISPVLFHEPLGVPQAKPSSVILGGEEWIEDLPEGFLSDPASGIHNPHDNRRRHVALA